MFSAQFLAFSSLNALLHPLLSKSTGYEKAQCISGRFPYACSPWLAADFLLADMLLVGGTLEATDDRQVCRRGISDREPLANQSVTFPWPLNLAFRTTAGIREGGGLAQRSQTEIMSMLVAQGSVLAEL